MKVGEKVTEVIETLKVNENKNRPVLLTSVAIVGLGFTVYHAFKAGPKAEEILKKRKEEIDNLEPDDSEGRKKAVVAGAKELFTVAAPTIVSATITVVSMVSATKTSLDRIATLSAAYTVANSAFKEHKDKEEEILGEKKAQQVREGISKEHAEAVTPDRYANAIVTGKGTTMCYDEFNDRVFLCSPEALGDAILKLSYEAVSEMWIDLSDFYEEINLKPTKKCEYFGWSVENLDHGKLPIYYTAILLEDKTPCLCLQFDIELREDAKRW